jgi:hypothetical protein
MRILFDQGTPPPLKEWLAPHEVETVAQRGWSELLNGDLLAAAADGEGFDLFVTTDQNLRSQQDLSRFGIAILVLMVANWPTLMPFASKIAAVVNKIAPGEYLEFEPM